MTKTIRSFLAVDIDDLSILRKISHVKSMLNKTGVDLKLIQDQNIHLTVRFFGDIQNFMVDMIYEEMKQISFNEFQIDLQGLGAFPKPTYPRIIWVGIKKGVEELKETFEKLEPRIRALGIKADYKGFNPHLTIARVRSRRNIAKLSELFREFENYYFGSFNVEVLRLKKSDLTPRGPIYTNLKEVRGKKQ